MSSTAPQRAAWLTLSALVVTAGLAGPAAAQRIDKFRAGEGTPYPVEMTAGPDGAIWWAENFGGAIGRISLDGDVKHYYIPVPIPGAFGIATGADGNIWFTESLENRIGRLSPRTGAMMEWDVPTKGSRPNVITKGPDGNMWFTELFAHKIGRITPDGVITEFPTPTAETFPKAIAAGPDGALWFCESETNSIGRITVTGEITEYAVPTANGSPYRIAAGPDGAMWFTEVLGNRIGRITMEGVVTEFEMPRRFSGPRAITAGPDRAMWFTTSGRDGMESIARISMNGQISEYRIPRYADEGAGFAYDLLPHVTGVPQGIALGADGNIWFTESGNGKIGRLTVPGRQVGNIDGDVQSRHGSSSRPVLGEDGDPVER